MSALWISENEDLKEFYESNLPWLKNCSWNLISYTILKSIAVKLNETSTSNEEWRKYAEEMGIDNNTMAVSVLHYLLFEYLEWCQNLPDRSANCRVCRLLSHV